MGAPHEREVDPRILDWVDGTLAERERERFVAELRVSPQLRADLAAYERTVAHVRQALQAEVPGAAAVAERVAQRVRSRLATAATPAAAPRWAGGRLWWGLAAAAALLAFAVWLDSWSPPQIREDIAVSGDRPSGAEQLGVGQAGEPAGAGLWRDKVDVRDDRESGGAERLAISPDGDARFARALTPSEQDGAGASVPKPGEPAIEEQAKGSRGAPAASPPAAAAPPPSAKVAAGEGATAEPAAPAAVTVVVEPEAANREGELQLAEKTDRSETERRLAAGPPPPAAESKSALADAPTVGRLRGGGAGPATGAKEPETMLPEVVLRSRVDGAARRSQPASGTAAKKDAKAPGADYDEFLRRELARLHAGREPAGPADRVPAPAAPTAVEVGATRWLAATALPPAEKGSDDFFLGAGRTQPVAEVAWVIEGSRDDVTALLRRLAEFARGEGLELRTGEVEASTFAAAPSSQTMGVGQPAPTAGGETGPGGPATSGSSGPATSGAKAPGAPAGRPSSASNTMRIVLRLQLAPGGKR